ncbi:MAG: hypothetical protein ACRYFS_11680 [Janthinobacterium lividum]
MDNPEETKPDPVKICKNCNYHHPISTDKEGVEINTPRCPACYAHYNKVMTHKAPVPEPKDDAAEKAPEESTGGEKAPASPTVEEASTKDD